MMQDQIMLQNAIAKITDAIKMILLNNHCTIYIYGSLSMNDFRQGWSDIDILCLTEQPFNEDEAKELVKLRQALLSDNPSNPYYRSFEGAIVYADDYLNNNSCRAVYWGTSGERITDQYVLDCFSKKELLDTGIHVCGNDLRPKMKMPSYSDLYSGVALHYRTIRQYAVTVPRSIKSYGWMLDICRCIYTLRTGDIIAKTQAAEWVLNNNICPVPNALEKALTIRKAPILYEDNADMMTYTTVLGDDIQRFADVLENEIERAKMPRSCD